MSPRMKIGDCRCEGLINDLFGSVSEFARLVETLGNSFTLGGLEVRYNVGTDRHSFWL